MIFSFLETHLQRSRYGSSKKGGPGILPWLRGWRSIIMSRTKGSIDYVLGTIERQWLKRYIVDTLLATALALGVTGIIYVLHLYPAIPNISFLYLLIVLGLSSTRGLYAAVITSIVAVLSFDFSLTEPLYTFTIARPEEWLALFIFLVTAITTGRLAFALRRRAEHTTEHDR